MITLKTTSEKISAWLRNREAVRGWSQFSDHELCHIRVRRSTLSKTSFGAKSSAERTLKATRVSERWQHATYVKGRMTQALVLRKIGHGYRQLRALIPAQFLGPGETGRRKANVRSRSGSDSTALPRFSAGSWRRTQW
jgi:hypothetical protein